MSNRLDRKRRKEGSLKKQFNFGRIDQEVMKRWDQNKTPLENFSLMGLQYSNKFESDNKKALNRLGMEAKPVDLTVPKEVKGKERGINFHLQHYTKALLIKYKDDYEKMKMDHTLNFYQKTAGELEKLCKKYIVLYGHPLFGDVYQEQLENQKEKERLEKERLEKEKLEKERLEKEKLEKERLEKEKLENQQKAAATAAIQKKKQPTTTSTKKMISKKTTTETTPTPTPTPTTTEVKKVVKKTPTPTTKKIISKK
ncbi:hypothetical protein RB653_007835 [Dictyostelium firmibasis]|uniref:Nucleolar protein 16 n=1 Tax=Dictyostelium firmibasis TaxID=79012 RepID=A0AAN7YPD4_9MYCE